MIKDIRRATRRQLSAEDKIRIVLEGLPGPRTASPSCGGAKARLAGDTARAATADAVKNLRREAGTLKEVVADLVPENRLRQKSTTGAGGDEA